MRDEERIEMYYKYGLMDWKSEQALQTKKALEKSNSFGTDLVRVLPSLIEHSRFKFKSRKKIH